MILQDALSSDYRRAQPLLSISAIYLEQGRPKDAEQKAEEALDILEIAVPQEHHERTLANCRLGRAVAAQGRVDEARPLFEQSIDPLLSSVESPYERRDCLAAAAVFFESQGGVEKVAKLEEALQAFEK